MDFFTISWIFDGFNGTTRVMGDGISNYDLTNKNGGKTGAIMEYEWHINGIIMEYWSIPSGHKTWPA